MPTPYKIPIYHFTSKVTSNNAVNVKPKNPLDTTIPQAIYAAFSGYGGYCWQRTT